MRALSLFVSMAFAAGVLACSDPGGSGGGVVDVNDAAGGDGALFDVPPSDSGTCTNGARSCDGQVAQQCVNGTLTDLFECPSNQICENGACKAGGDTNVAPDGGDTSNPIDTTPNETTEDPCDDKECGADGLGGSCGTCLPPEGCNPSGQCVTTCTANCSGKECGNDGCGGSCGSCGSDEQCVSGGCEPVEDCDCGLAECGVDNCGNSCGTCGNNESCQAGSCVGVEPDGLDCSGMIDCIYGDGGCFDTSADDAEFQACADACYTDASTTGAGEFDAYLGCLQACPETDGDPATTADDLAFGRCRYEDCTPSEVACFFDETGAGTCGSIIDCANLCADGDTECVDACWEDASAGQQIALYGVLSCLGVECPDPDDQACSDEALTTGLCADFYNDCTF